MTPNQLANQRKYQKSPKGRAAEKRYKQSPKGKEMQRWVDLKRRFGITKSEWLQKFEAQDRRCAICRTDDPGKSHWHQDHSHVTNRLRGILCCRCNLALGLYESVMSGAFETYLRAYNE
jgi:hypothetical protein